MERPDAVRELEAQQAIVLTRRPNRAFVSIQVKLRRAPVGSARYPIRESDLVGPWTRRRGAGRIVVGDLLRPFRVANVEDANARIKLIAGKGRRVLPVVDAAIVGAVGEDGETHKIGKDLLECQCRWASFERAKDEP